MADFLKALRRSGSSRRTRSNEADAALDTNFPNSPDRTPPSLSPLNSPAPRVVSVAAAGGERPFAVTKEPGAPDGAPDAAGAESLVSPPPKVEDIVTFFYPVHITLKELDVSANVIEVLDPLSIKEPKIVFSSQGTVERSSTPNGEVLTGEDGKPPYVFSYGEEKVFKRLVYHEVKGIELKVQLLDADSDEAIATGVLVIRDTRGTQMASLDLAGSAAAAAAGSPWIYTVRFEYTLGDRGHEKRAKKPQHPPNLLYVTLCGAKDLRAVDKGGTSDPYVKLKAGKWEATTSCKSKTLEPMWNERFAIALNKKEPKPELRLTVMDKNTLMDEFLGEYTMDLRKYADATALDTVFVEEFLLDKKGKGVTAAAASPSPGASDASKGKEPPAAFLGTLRVKIVPSYAGRDVDMSKYTQGDIDYEADEAAGPDEDPEEEKLDPEDAKKEQERIKAEREAYEKEMARLEAIEVKEGNYTIMVHIIEVRDLKSEDANGSNDPVVRVECFGQVQHTKIKKNCSSAVFDDLFYFEIKDMTRDDLEASTIKASVMDADVVSKDLIGAFQTDFEFVYFRPNHELYRAWVALVDNHETSDAGAQGYLLLSITVLGPGDKPPAHDRKKELEAEQKAMAAGGDMPNVSALMPQVTQSLHFLEATIYMAMDLPPMDKNHLTQSSSINAYVKIKFGDADEVRTTVRTVKSRSNTGGLLSVAFEERIWIPILVPTMTNRIEISLWDEDLGKDETVGTCVVYDFKAVQKGFHEKPFWVPIYGALFPDSNPLYNHDEIDRQNTKSREATTYRGRLLISLKDDHNDGKHKRIQKVAKKPLKPRDLPPVLPTSSSTVLRCQVYAGYDLPDTDGLIKSSLSVHVCIGPYYAATQRVAWSKERPGVVHWNAVVQIPEPGGEPMLLPLDVRQLPDVFVYLKKGKGDGAEVVSFHRISAEDIFKTNFEQEPFWLKLERDKANNVCKVDQYPGTLLLRMGLGPRALAETIHWEPIDKLTLKPVRLNVYMYMGRDLCPTDDTGLLDPYVKVRFNGEVKQIAKVRQTRNPNFFATLFFDTMLPDEDHLWPEVTVEVWDWDPGLDPDDFVGSVRVPTQKVFRSSAANFRNKKLPTPKWYSLQFANPEDAQGELLLNFEVMTKGSEDEHVPSPRDITPAKEDVIVEIIPIGLRDLQQKGPIPILKPFAEFRVGDEQTIHCTEASRLPNTIDPNFRPDTIRIPCQIPSDPMLAPCLNVSVFDKRLGGLSKPLLGTTSIPLGSRMKGGASYRPPGGIPFAINPFAEDPPKTRRAPDPPSPVRSPKTPGFGGNSGVSPGGTATPGTVGTAGAPWSPRGSGAAASAAAGDGGVEESKGGEAAPPAKLPSKRHSLMNAAGSFFQGVKDEANTLLSPAAMVSGTAAIVTKQGSDAAVEVVEEEDTIETYMVGREVLTDEMEWHLDSTPFEEFGLFRGMKRLGGGVGLFNEPYMRMGYFKGVVRVIRGAAPDEASAADPLPFDLKELASPAAFQVRVYVLKGTHLRSKDALDNKSDPYIKIKLGRTVISDRKNAIMDVVNDADFFKYYEMNAKFPGAGKLEVGIWDKDPLGTDELIGKTVVDLEDRWFSKQWRTLGWDLTEPTDPKLLTPVESRSLWSPNSTNPQGSISMWVDILPSKDVTKFKPVDITPPLQKAFELRLVVWKVRNWTEPGDPFTGMTDMFFRTRLGAEGEWQDTDTHLRAQNAMSFNWRLKFPVSLPAKGEGSSYLTLQAWDLDVLYNDLLCETTFDLCKFFTRAFKKNEPVQYFPLKVAEKKKQMGPLLAALKAAKKKRKASRLVARNEAEAATAAAVATAAATTTGSINGGSADAAVDIEAGIQSTTEKTALLQPGAASAAGGYGGAKPAAAAAAGASAKGGNGTTASSAAGSRRGLADASRRASADGGAGKVPKKKISLWSRVKETIGMGEDPDYSGWIQLKKTVVGPRGVPIVKVCGEVCVTMELLPESYAKRKPAGLGRAEPNANPPMPEPEGRPDPMQMLNPIYMCKTCLGEGLCIKFCGVFLCLGFFVAFMFVGPSFYDLAQICLAIPYGGWLALFCFALLFCGCGYTARTCQKQCGCGHEDEDPEEAA